MGEMVSMEEKKRQLLEELDTTKKAVEETRLCLDANLAAELESAEHLRYNAKMEANKNREMLDHERASQMQEMEKATQEAEQMMRNLAPLREGLSASSTH